MGSKRQGIDAGLVAPPRKRATLGCRVRVALDTSDAPIGLEGAVGQRESAEIHASSNQSGDEMPVILSSNQSSDEMPGILRTGNGRPIAIHPERLQNVWQSLSIYDVPEKKDAESLVVDSNSRQNQLSRPPNPVAPDRPETTQHEQLRQSTTMQGSAYVEHGISKVSSKAFPGGQIHQNASNGASLLQERGVQNPYSAVANEGWKGAPAGLPYGLSTISPTSQSAAESVGVGAIRSAAPPQHQTSGFTTARGQSVVLDANNMHTAAIRLSGNESDAPKSSNSREQSQQACFGGLTTARGAPVQLDPTRFQKAQGMLADNPSNEIQAGSGGFTTARGKSVQIDTARLQQAQNLLADDKLDDLSRCTVPTQAQHAPKQMPTPSIPVHFDAHGTSRTPHVPPFGHASFAAQRPCHWQQSPPLGQASFGAQRPSHVPQIQRAAVEMSAPSQYWPREQFVQQPSHGLQVVRRPSQPMQMAHLHAQRPVTQPVAQQPVASQAQIQQMQLWHMQQMQQQRPALQQHQPHMLPRAAAPIQAASIPLFGAGAHRDGSQAPFLHANPAASTMHAVAQSGPSAMSSSSTSSMPPPHVPAPQFSPQIENAIVMPSAAQSGPSATLSSPTSSLPPHVSAPQFSSASPQAESTIAMPSAAQSGPSATLSSPTSSLPPHVSAPQFSSASPQAESTIAMPIIPSSIVLATGTPLCTNDSGRNDNAEPLITRKIDEDESEGTIGVNVSAIGRNERAEVFTLQAAVESSAAVMENATNGIKASLEKKIDERDDDVGDTAVGLGGKEMTEEIPIDEIKALRERRTGSGMSTELLATARPLLSRRYQPPGKNNSGNLSEAKAFLAHMKSRQRRKRSLHDDTIAETVFQVDATSSLGVSSECELSAAKESATEDHVPIIMWDQQGMADSPKQVSNDEAGMAAELMQCLNASEDTPEKGAGTAVVNTRQTKSWAPLVSRPCQRESLFERFQRTLHAAHTESLHHLRRFGVEWFEMQCKQIVLSLSLRNRQTWESIDSYQEMVCARLLHRCKAEISGGRSALARVCENTSFADKHMVLLCTGVLPGVGQGNDTSVELSDGWYFIAATLDPQLKRLLQQGKFRVGRKFRICMSNITGIPIGGCDPLDLPREARLHLVYHGCRPTSKATRLGLKQQNFPPARIQDIQPGCGNVPMLDMVVLRVLPQIYISWNRGSPQGGAKFPEESSISQECAMREQLAEAEFERAASDLNRGVEEHNEEHMVSIQTRVESRLADRDVSLQQSLVVLDAQVLKRPQSAWWSSLAVLKLASGMQEEGPQPLQRIRMCSLKLGGKSRRAGPVCIYTSRASKMETCMPSRIDSALLGVPISPFSFGFADYRLGRTPALGSFGNAHNDCTLDWRFKGQYCDLVGCLISVDPVHPAAIPGASFTRSRCLMYVLTFGQRLCRIWLEDRSAHMDGAMAQLSKSRSKFLALQSTVEPQVLAFENLTFEWQDTRSGIVHFQASRLQVRISRTPSDTGLKEYMSRFQVSAADIANAANTLSQLACSNATTV